MTTNNKNKSFFSERREAKTSVFDTIGNSSDNKDQFILKGNSERFNGGMNDGDSVYFRIISLANEDIEELNYRVVTRAWHSEKDNKSGENPFFNCPDPGHPHNQEILDSTGTPIVEGKLAEKNRIPVFVTTQVNKKGKMEKEFNRVMYMDLPKHVLKQLKVLSQDEKNDLGFTSIPDYWLELTYNPSEKMQPFSLDAVTIARNPLSAEVGVPIEESEFIVGKDGVFDTIDDFSEEATRIIELIHDVTDEEFDVATVKKLFATTKSATETSPARKPRVIEDDEVEEEEKPVRRKLKKVVEEEEEEEEEAPVRRKATKVVEEDEEEDEEPAPKRKSRFSD